MKNECEGYKAGYEEGRLYGKQESLLSQAIIDQMVVDARQEGIEEGQRKERNRLMKQGLLTEKQMIYQFTNWVRSDPQKLHRRIFQYCIEEGRREVVEWGLETCPHDLFGEGTQCWKRVCDECWLDKIKEWGIE